MSDEYRLVHLIQEPLPPLRYQPTTVHERTPTSVNARYRMRARLALRIPLDPNQHPPLAPQALHALQSSRIRDLAELLNLSAHSCHSLNSLKHLSHHTCDADLNLRSCRSGIDKREVGPVREHLAAAVACHGANDAAH